VVRWHRAAEDADDRDVFAILLSDRVGRIRLQVFGFVGCAVGLFLASMSGFYTGGTHILLIFLGFMLFNFMTNLGPNTIETPKPFPVKARINAHIAAVETLMNALKR
jgi:nitrate/nitrite transporter NarK